VAANLGRSAEPESLPVVAESLPLEEESLLVEPESLPVESESLPVVAESVPVEAESVPLEEESLLVEPESLPVEPESLPVVAESFPVEAESLPVFAESLPVEAESVPLEEEGLLVEPESLPVRFNIRSGRRRRWNGASAQLRNMLLLILLDQHSNDLHQRGERIQLVLPHQVNQSVEHLDELVVLVLGMRNEQERCKRRPHLLDGLHRAHGHGSASTVACHRALFTTPKYGHG
jgi:hypothetical protein